MNDQARDSALITFTNVGHSSMRVFTVLYATAALYLAQVFALPCGELLADIAEMAISFGHKSTEHLPLMAIDESASRSSKPVASHSPTSSPPRTAEWLARAQALRRRHHGAVLPRGLRGTPKPHPARRPSTFAQWS